MSMEPAVPPVNIYESSGQVSVAMPIPGAHPDHIRVVVRPSALRVTAECKYPQDGQNYRRREWQVGAWQIEVPLPGVDPVGARAHLTLGVLVVTAPLIEGATGEHRPAVLG